MCITKFVTKLVSKCVTKYDQPLNLSPTLSLNLSPNAVHHYIWHQFCHQIWWFTKFITKFGDKFVTKYPGGPCSFRHLPSFIFSSPSSPPSPLSHSCNTSLTEGPRPWFLPFLDCDLSYYNSVCIVCIVCICTFFHDFNIKFKCGLGLLDELYCLVPRPNHLAICL